MQDSIVVFERIVNFAMMTNIKLKELHVTSKNMLYLPKLFVLATSSEIIHFEGIHIENFEGDHTSLIRTLKLTNCKINELPEEILRLLEHVEMNHLVENENLSILL